MSGSTSTKSTATAPQFSSKSPTIRRILREAAELSGTPSSDYAAEPLESDLFEWHFTMKGPPNSPYSGGLYHGRIVLPPSYPLRPPSFRFTTPNGRFETNREICLSISGHHEETWQPAWGLRTAIVALRSFMETDARGQLGGLDTPDTVRRRLAHESASFTCPTCAKSNLDIIRECEEATQESSASQEHQEVAVPSELKMGWKDEMEANKAASESLSKESSRENGRSHEAELAEGFIPTAAATSPQQLPSNQPLGTQPAQQTQPAPNAILRRPALINSPQPRRRAVGWFGPVQEDGVPLWIDRAIVALVVLLAALVLKMLFSA